MSSPSFRSLSSAATRCYLAALLCLLATSCLFGESAAEKEARLAAIDYQDDQIRTLRFLVRSVISSADVVGRAVAEAQDTVTGKQASVAFRARVAQDAIAALSMDPPLIGLLDVWAMTLQYFAVIQRGIEDGSVPTEVEPPMRASIAEVETEMQRLLGDRFDAAKASIHKFAAARPVQDGLVRSGVTGSMLENASKAGIFSWVPAVTLNPFDSVGEGLGESAQAIETVSRAVERFTDIVAYLPLQISWRFEGFEYQIAANPQLTKVATGFEEAAQSTSDAVSVIEALPQRMREEMVLVLEEIDPQLADLRATLADVKATLAGVEAASASLGPTANSFEDAATSLEAMAAQLDVTLKTFEDVYILLDGDPDAPPPPPDAPKGHPFDVREFDAAGQTMTVMAAQLQTTLDSFQTLLGDPALTNRIEDATGSAQRSITTIVWSIVGGALALAAGLLILLLAYRRLTRPATPAS